MDNEIDDADDQDEGEGGGFNAELLSSYLAFVSRALRKRWVLAAGVFATGLALTIVTSMYFPRTYTCVTTLMAQGSMLDANNSASALSGASDLIMRHENLEAMIRDGNLIRKFEERRPPLLKLKDRIIKSLFGDWSDKIKMASLVGTLETKLMVSTDQGDLTIRADWGDPLTAAEVAESARESFLRARHSAEMSAFEEKMAILDGHAGKLRDEIASLAKRLKAAREENATQAREQARAASESAPKAGGGAPSAPLRRRAISADAAIPELTDKLAVSKRKLADMEGERERKMREEQAKLSEAKLKFTPSHPSVITQEERLAAVSQVPAELSLLRAEVKDLQREIEQREALGKQATGSVAGALGSSPSGAGGSTADPLPSEIMQLLDKDDADPALTAQLSSAVLKFGRLREDVSTARVELDLAQAAFNRRYKIIVPAEPPNKPTKPKPAVIIGGGLFVALLLALVFPILLELRRGIIVERWQVHHLQLPVLAELRLPPHSGE